MSFTHSDNFIGLAVTLVSYLGAIWVFRFVHYRIVFHPIVVGAFLVAILCAVINSTLAEYQQSVSYLSWLLGPVTVALAVPLYQQIKLIARSGMPALIVIIVGGTFGPLIAFLCLFGLGFADELTWSVLTKSITTPLAVETSKRLGSIPDLAAAVVILTGILGVLFSTSAFKLMRCNIPAAQGLALGTVAHAIGTARAQQLGNSCAGYSTMALCVNGVLTAIILPLMMWIFG
jgi:putative effector of murein hydrolase